MTGVDTPDLIYDAETQRPFLHGRRVMSVTDVLKIMGLYDAMAASDYHLWMGQNRHAAVELWVKKTLDLSTVHPDVLPSVEAYLEFESATGFVPYPGEHGSEVKKWNPILQLATRIDLLGKFPDGSEGIVELKSGTVSDVTGLQTAGQDICIGGPRRKRFGLSVPQTGKPTVKPFQRADDYLTFISMLNAARWRVDHGQVKL